MFGSQQNIETIKLKYHKLFQKITFIKTTQKYFKRTVSLETLHQSYFTTTSSLKLFHQYYLSYLALDGTQGYRKYKVQTPKVDVRLRQVIMGYLQQDIYNIMQNQQRLSHDYFKRTPSSECPRNKRDVSIEMFYQSYFSRTSSLKLLHQHNFRYLALGGTQGY